MPCIELVGVFLCTTPVAEKGKGWEWQYKVVGLGMFYSMILQAVKGDMRSGHCSQSCEKGASALPGYDNLGTPII